MIFYFSGTGNSLWVAQELGNAFDETLISIATALKTDSDEVSYTLRPTEKIFFVFPVHSWGPAVIMQTFISRLRLDGYTDQPVYSISTCGDECGYTGDMIRRSLGKKGIVLTESHSVEMPNNYVLLPGFDVDSKEVEEKKLLEAPEHIDKIIQVIKEPNGRALYKTGSMPFLKSRMIYPLFAHLVIKQNSFYATDACISCGICVKGCPTGTISMEKGTLPQWRKDTCVQCVACIHYCPERAIEYGNISRKKGRYHHPAIKTIS